MEIKQLKYFVIAADVGSFSEAAKVLYTTQSSVSKVVLSLENELGYPLFNRASKGISLTQEGEKFHIRVSKLVADFDSLENESTGSLRNIVKISSNHSSWLANCFSEFYELNKDSNLCYQIHADSTSNIINRIRLMEDEAGFVYVFPDTRLQFEYKIKKYNLDFEEMYSLDGMIFFSPEDELSNKKFDENMIHDLKYIQSERDEYLLHGAWRTESGQAVDISDDIAVITNSDYVMHAMLKNNSLANISAGSFNNFNGGNKCGIPLKNDEGSIQFGVITNKNAKVGKVVKEYIEFIKEKLLN